MACLIPAGRESTRPPDASRFHRIADHRMYRQLAHHPSTIAIASRGLVSPVRCTSWCADWSLHIDFPGALGSALPSYVPEANAVTAAAFCAPPTAWRYCQSPDAEGCPVAASNLDSLGSRWRSPVCQPIVRDLGRAWRCDGMCKGTTRAPRNRTLMPEPSIIGVRSPCGDLLAYTLQSPSTSFDMAIIQL